METISFSRLQCFADGVDWYIDETLVVSQKDDLSEVPTVLKPGPIHACITVAAIWAFRTHMFGDVVPHTHFLKSTGEAPPEYNSWMPLCDTHQPVAGSSGRKSRLPLQSYLINCSQCAETTGMKDICAILLTPALGKDHFAHNFPFPQNRPPVFYIFTVVSEYVYHNSILAYRSCHCRR